MLIASKGKNQIVNTDQAASIFVNNERRIIVSTPGGKNMVLDEYETRDEAMKAMEMLADRIKTAPTGSCICFMPTDKEVKAMTANGSSKTVQHYQNGAKVKGHGGS